MAKRLQNSAGEAADSLEVKDEPLSKRARVLLRLLALAEAAEDFRKSNPITRSIRYKYKNCIVLVWCPRHQVRCDIVASLLHSYGKVVVRQDRWTFADVCSSSMNFWGGMVVTYENQESAEAAAKGIPLRSRYVKTLLLHKLVEWLGNYEITLPESQEIELSISNLSRVRMSTRVTSLLEDLLGDLGNITAIKFPKDIMRVTPESNRKIVCQVKYKYATQAIAAHIILEGRKWYGAGMFSTHVPENQNCEIFEKMFYKILELVTEHFEEAFFPDKRVI